MNPIVLDLETTGLDPHRHGICAIGAKKALTGAEFYIECRIREEAEVDLAALDVNGFSVEQARDPQLPSEETALYEFLRFADWQDHTGPILLAGMNIGHFDLPFLEAVAARAGVAKAFCHRSLDLHSMAVLEAVRREIAVPAKGLNTDAIYEALGLPPEPRPHHALTGVRCEFAAFKKLMEVRR